MDAGVVGGFQDDIPSIEELTPTFERIQRQLLLKSRKDSGEMLSATSGSQRRTQSESGEELSFMIVSHP